MPDEPIIPPVVDAPATPVTQTVIEKHETVTTTGDTAKTAAVYQGPHFDDYVKAGLCYIVVIGYVISYLYGQYTGHHPDEGERATYSNYVMLALGFYLGAAVNARLNKAAT